MPLQNWPIRKLLAQWERLNLAPKYQRGAVWDTRRKTLLVDSVLAGLDVPKVYLHPVRGNAFYDFEVIDGQQRLRAIKEFVDDMFAVPAANGVSIEGKGDVLFSALAPKKREHFLRYRLTISIARVSPHEARMLFSRLQLGSSLNQPELRNAMPSVAGHEIDTLVLNHAFFNESKIAEGRFRRHDYLTHALAYECLLSINPGLKDIKASALRQFITSFDTGMGSDCVKSAMKVLDLMRLINQQASGLLRNKWTFFDTYVWLRKNIASAAKVKPALLAQAIKKIEADRRRYTRNPEMLLTKNPGPNSDARLLFNYVIAYRASGSLIENIDTRQKFMVHRLDSLLND
jgi:hypothetical protein